VRNLRKRDLKRSAKCGLPTRKILLELKASISTAGKPTKITFERSTLPRALTAECLLTSLKDTLTFEEYSMPVGRGFETVCPNGGEGLNAFNCKQVQTGALPYWVAVVVLL
jgi:hypothetical protein